ncbi:hypothetical protein WP3S18E05_06950 [Klebsiella sp. WP3-S18-ESBL-05]|nr:hypothetical protein WP3S18E05_06950 [Klebsiella sp. WP3-S18-ESBL-05]
MSNGRVSRSGVIPGPTVKVRMGESNDSVGLNPARVIHLPLVGTPKTALILVTIILMRFFYHESDATFLFWYSV